jgi:asparagine synthase (glutamine-hydrolysing)
VPGREFRFASELKALREGGPWRPNAGMLARFLAYRQTGAREETFLEGVLQVPPATLLEVSARGVAARPYWSLPEAPEPPPGDAAAHAARVRELLEDSVALRMRSDVPVGSCLSGGLDSATIVSLVAGEGRRTGAAARRAFTATFPGVPGDETPWAAASAEHAAAEWHRTAPTPAGLLDDLDRLVRAQDEPFSGPSIYAEWKVMELAREHATTVLLNGQGGDEVFAGYHFFFGDLWWSLLRRGSLPTLRREMKAHAAVHGPGSAKAILLPALRSRAAGPVHALRGGPRVPWMARDLAASLAARAPSRPPDLRASLRESRSFRMLPHLLRQTDRSSMAFSREVRLPFLDHRLVEYADALPDAEHLEGGTTKRALREAIRGLVPEAVRTRRDKLGFALPMARWMREGLADALRDAVAGRTARERGLVDPAGAGRALDAFLAGDDAQAVPVWNCFLAERWMRACVDGPGGGP